MGMDYIESFNDIIYQLDTVIGLMGGDYSEHLSEIIDQLDTVIVLLQNFY